MKFIEILNFKRVQIRGSKSVFNIFIMYQKVSVRQSTKIYETSKVNLLLSYLKIESLLSFDFFNS